ncbi:CLUMA_CG013403, isoform A [Clunio marinus]|uniref:sn-1-specific diacylglycerol lipase n=1 Tax=Clunio marinus TaxID=568069 RepID=A0A1J1IIS6_9DIPT|nr:CLUMA_CG013403, isoform A [Clunio marinus]
MPALKIFGRKWLVASDDFVFPCIFETLWRVIILVFVSTSLYRYWIFFDEKVIIEDNINVHFLQSPSPSESISCRSNDVVFIQTYFIGFISILLLNLPLLLLMIYHSAQGSITDTESRRLVKPLLYLKIIFILPETAMNVMGTIWMFSGFVNCFIPNDNFANTTIEVVVIFYWIILCLIIFGFIFTYDPMGSRKYRRLTDGNDNINSDEHHEFMHRKVTKLWLRRLKFLVCCVGKDENGDEAFTQSAELFSHLFRGTDLVPSDILAGSILLRVRQKKEYREQNRIDMLNDFCPGYSSDLPKVFNSQCPSWMTLKNAQHFLRFAVSSYGWPMVCAIAPCKGCFGMIRKIKCCACMRSKPDYVVDDNCCLCNVAGARYASRIHSDDVIYATFKNQVFEIPFCILADHSKHCVVLSIRGSWSMSDIFTDLAAAPAPFHAQGMPENTVAHYGMSLCCEKILAKLMEDNLIERSLAQYPDYDFVITGHSLGAGLAVLVGAKLRPLFPDVKVYGFATPSGLLTREAAKYTEQFAFTVVCGDDFVARMSLESVENLKHGILETLQSCRLPKYRVVRNGFTYAVLGIPSKDLEKSWHEVTETPHQSNYSSILLDPQSVATISHHAFGGNPTVQKPRQKLYIAGRILHIVRKKKEHLDRKSKQNAYEMKWAEPEDFHEMKIMPRMMFDHFPHNILKVLTTILKDRKSDSILSVEKI